MTGRSPLALTSLLLTALVVTACSEEEADPPAPTPDPVCGNGLLEDVETCEGDPLPEGCDPASCTVAAGYECLPAPPEPTPDPTGGETGADEPPEWSSTCTLLPVCGNGIVEVDETCDDEDTAPGDGCDAECQIEAGFSCSGAPSTCAACGDGFVDPGEACDAGELIGNGTPGCSDTCEVIPGWECFNEPSMCGPVCGDGQWFDTSIPGVTQGFAEDCDDGNTASGDGCSANCTLEAGCDCTGNPPGLTTCECGLSDSTGDDSGSDSGTDSGTTGDTGETEGTTAGSTTGDGMTTGTTG